MATDAISGFAGLIGDTYFGSKFVRATNTPKVASAAAITLYHVWFDCRDNPIEDAFWRAVDATSYSVGGTSADEEMGIRGRKGEFTRLSILKGHAFGTGFVYAVTKEKIGNTTAGGTAPSGNCYVWGVMDIT